jgi:predicted transcriptional regulator
LSILFFSIFLHQSPIGFGVLVAEDQVAAIGTLSSTATAAFWLASVNLILAVFNLAPGFPLDGGRLFRAFLWWRSGDQLKATRRAAETGRLFGWTLMVVGLFVFLRGDVVGGAWLALIGWFLSRLAAASVPQLMIDRVLQGLCVKNLMRTRFEAIDSEMPIDRFVRDYLLRSSQVVWPVQRQGRDVGVFNLKDVSAIEAPTQSSLKVSDIMRPIEEIAQLNPDLSGRDALKRLADFTESPLPVIQCGRVVGLIHHGDILKWISLHTALNLGLEGHESPR